MERAIRRCPKIAPAYEAARQEGVIKFDREPDPAHPDACALLKLEAVSQEPRFTAWLLAHRGFSKGALWRDGGLSRQPIDVMDAVAVIDDEIARIERERLAAIKSKGGTTDGEGDLPPMVNPYEGTG